MGETMERRMHARLLRALLCLAIGFATLFVVQAALDAGNGGMSESGEGSASAVPDAGASEIASFVLEGDARLPGMGELPEGFLAECMDPRDLGEAFGSADAGVVGISSELAAPDLYSACLARLAQRGWLQVRSDWEMRCSLMKGDGELRWMYLDVSRAANGSAAVMVMRGQR